jgi:hypothetical protein
MRANPDAVGLHCDQSSRVCVGTLAITSPGAVTYVSGTVTIQVAASPANNPPAEVVIRKNQMPLATVAAPFSYAWQTDHEAEGSYEIDAIADVGAQTIMASPVTIWVDHTPPSISARVPAPNAANIALSDQVQVTFSETLDPSSVPSTAISLSTGGSTLNTTATLGSDGKTITIGLNDRTGLSFRATITATVSPTVKDLAGNPVGAIGSWSWSAPLWVKLPALTGSAPSVALDSTGRANVTYLAANGSSTALAALRYAPGATWDLGLGSPTNATVTAARIVIGSDDGPVVAWAEDHLGVARWNGAQWTRIGGDVETEANAPAGGSPYLSSLALDATNAPYVGFGEAPCGTCNSGFLAAWSSGAWQLLPVGTQAGPGGPEIRIDANAAPVGLFPGALGALPALERYKAGVWASIDSFSGGLIIPALAIDQQNRPVILVQAVESNLEVIHVRAYGDSAPSELTPSLPTGSAGAIGIGRIAIAQSGDVLVLWTQLDGGSHNRFHVARFRGSAWDTTYGVLSAITNGDAVDAQIAVDAAGVPTVAWDERDSSSGMDSVFVWKSNY